MKMILALDLSYTATGYASTDGRLGRMKFKGRGLARLADAKSRLVDLASGYDHVVVEGYSYHSKGRAAVAMGELGAVVRLALYERDVQMTEVSPASLKKYATGKGNAAKEEVLAAAIRRLGYERASTDEADALWLLEIGRALFDPTTATPVPAKHREALERIKPALV